MHIRNKKIGENHLPFVIAEMSANHNGDINNAYKIIDMAKNCGADAVKIQTYKPETITLKMKSPEFTIEGGLWHGQTLYELYESAYLPWEWHKPIFDYAEGKGITIFSSPFDKTAIDLLEDLNSPAYKIASFEAIDLPLIKYAAGTGKPLIISTGMADLQEIEEAIDAAYEGGCKNLAVLHCVSGYPAPPQDYNLKTILDMKDKFNIPVGLSDHTIDNATAIASIALGASIIEKHVTLDRDGGGPDDSFSLESNELMSLCKDLKTAWESLGDIDYGRKSSEIGNIKFRRSLYFINKLKKGDKIKKTDIKSVRPGFGLPPKLFEQVIGCKVLKDVEYGKPVNLEDIEGLKVR